MATTEGLGKALAAPKKEITLQDMILNATKELGKALPAHMGPDRLVRIALTNIRMVPDLALCTPASFLGSLFTLAQLGLEPVAGRAYLLPFKNSRKINGEWKTVREVQAVIGYKGYVELFYRHERAVVLSWGIVRTADEFDFIKGTNAYLNHREAVSDRGEVRGYWVMAELKNGGKVFEYMSAKDCMEHGKQHSKTYDKKADKFYDNSPWVKEPDSMCLKTVLIQLAKLLPMAFELQQAILSDETSRDFREGIDSAFDLPVNATIDEEPTNGEPVTSKEGKAAVTVAKQAVMEGMDAIEP